MNKDKYKLGGIVRPEIPDLNSLWIRTTLWLNEQYRLEERVTRMICVGHMIPGSPFDLVQFAEEDEVIQEVKNRRLWSVNLRDFPIQLWETRDDPRFPSWNNPPRFDMIIYKKADETT